MRMALRGCSAGGGMWCGEVWWMMFVRQLWGRWVSQWPHGAGDTRIHDHTQSLRVTVQAGLTRPCPSSAAGGLLCFSSCKAGCALLISQRSCASNVGSTLTGLGSVACHDASDIRLESLQGSQKSAGLLLPSSCFGIGKLGRARDRQHRRSMSLGS